MREECEARNWVVQATSTPVYSLVRIWKGDQSSAPTVSETAPTLDEALLLAVLQAAKGEKV